VCSEQFSFTANLTREAIMKRITFLLIAAAADRYMEKFLQVQAD